MHKRAAACLVASALVGVAPRTRAADEMMACVAAAEGAQRMRAAGKLLQARASLAICSRDACPALVRNDCTRWRQEVERDVPTIVLRAQDAKGAEITDAKVWLDGTLITEKIDGQQPIEVDPGQHQIAGEHAGSKKVQKDIVIQKGDRNRTISLPFEELEIPPPEGRPPPPPPPRVSSAAWVFTGLGVAAAGVGTFFLVSAIRDKNTLEGEHCKPFCDQSRVEAGQRKTDLATVGYGAAILSAGIATYFFLTPTRPKSTTLPSREVLVTPLHGGAVATWTERF
jgi:hypothetical protein